MNFLCTLDLPNNTCPYLSVDKKHCMADNTKCGFRISTEPATKHERKEKWFEKYYKNR